MKKRWICVPFLAAFLLTGCGQTAPTGSTAGTDQTSDINQITAEFFASDYEYTKTTVRYTESEGEEAGSRTVYEGAVIQSPYEECVTVVESSTKSAWTEAYYSGSGETVDAILLTDAGWTHTRSKRERPYGYGQETLTFVNQGEQELFGKSAAVYTTDYTIDITPRTGGDPVLSAVIFQTYYVDVETQKLVRIVTDLTDLDEKTQMMNDITANGVTAEQAENNLKNTETTYRMETLDIHQYGGSVTITPPEEESGSAIFSKNFS